VAEIRLCAGIVGVRWIYGKYGIRSMGRFTMSGKKSKLANTKGQLITKTQLQDGEDIPFGPPPEEYSYRCFQCGCEIWVNEAIIDFELGYAEFEGREVVMPVLGCPGCNRETMKYTGIKSSPEGR
jgi:hypothetical protein